MNGDRGFISNTYVQLLYAYLADQGLDAVALLGRPCPDASDGGLGRYPMAEWRQLLETAAQALHDPLLGLHLGQSISPSHIGVLGYTILACANLGEALLRLQRFYRLVYDAEPMQVQQQDDAISLEWGLDYGRPGELVDTTAITALVQFARDITGQQASPSYVSFINPAPADIGPYKAYFRCALAFDQPTTIVRFPVVFLASPLRQPDAGLLAILEQQATNLLQKLPAVDDYEQQVRRAIIRLARTAAPSIERVAEALHSSVRTLQRRLAERGLNFQDLLEDTRFRMAKEYLSDRRLQLSEVAQLLGYSEQSAFNRAFKRWSGSTPRAWRRALVS